jgi:hypothetical protein
MYTCSICTKEVTPPVKCCEGSTIYAKMSAVASGFGGVSEPVRNNNVTEESAMVLRQMMSMVLAKEFFGEKKDSIFANDIRIKDDSTGRTFTFTLTANEV